MNNDLRTELRRENLKQKAVPIVLVLCFLIYGFLSLPSISQPSSVYGVVDGLRGAEGDGVRLFLDVKLDSGKSILVAVPNSGAYYKKGRRLRLQKRTSNVLGGSEYTFAEYVRTK